jgi:hypothetical protein
MSASMAAAMPGSDMSCAPWAIPPCSAVWACS